MKKVLVISTSMRDESNSDTLATAFLRGANEVGNETKYISLADKKISFCKGCIACQHKGECVIDDDAADIIEKMKESEVIVFATPVYFYELSGQLKTLLDRTYPLYPAEYAFRDIYFIATSADPANTAIDGAVNGIKSWISCFEKASLAGVVHGAGIEFAGDAFKNEDALQKAYDMGRSIK